MVCMKYVDIINTDKISDANNKTQIHQIIIFIIFDLYMSDFAEKCIF